MVIARDAHEAELFRRGPTDGWQLIHRDTGHDQLDDGAWNGGRIDAWREGALQARGAQGHRPDHPPCGVQISDGNAVRRNFGVGSGVDWQVAGQGGRVVLAVRGKLPLNAPSRPARMRADFAGRIPAPAAAPDAARSLPSMKRR